MSANPLRDYLNHTDDVNALLRRIYVARSRGLQRTMHPEVITGLQRALLRVVGVPESDGRWDKEYASTVCSGCAAHMENLVYPWLMLDAATGAVTRSRDASHLRDMDEHPVSARLEPAHAERVHALRALMRAICVAVQDGRYPIPEEHARPIAAAIDVLHGPVPEASEHPGVAGALMYATGQAAGFMDKAKVAEPAFHYPMPEEPSEQHRWAIRLPAHHTVYRLVHDRPAAAPSTGNDVQT